MLHSPLLYYFVLFLTLALQSQQPNIILILVDDMGYSDLGSYGGEISTPNLDRLAEEGVRFRNFYNTAKCFPTRASLLTGRYAQEVGYHERYDGPILAQTLAESLRAAGYRTYMSGKHHGAENPYDRGFDRYFGLRDGAANHHRPGARKPGEPQPANKGRDRFWAHDSEVFHYEDPAFQHYFPEDFYSTRAFTDYALDFLKDDQGSSKPFFLYLSYTAPHDPLMAPEELIERYRKLYSQGYEPVRRARYQRQIESGLIDPTTTPLTPADYQDWDALDADARELEIDRMATYAAMIDYLDTDIGRLLQYLESTGDLERTVIFFVSDNGSSAEIVRQNGRPIGEGPVGSPWRWYSLRRDWANVSNTPFREYKNSSLQGGICTPLIAWYPARFQQDALSDFAGHMIDFHPTVLELALGSDRANWPGTDAQTLPGESLLPALLGRKHTRNNPLYFEWQSERAIIAGTYKAFQMAKDSPWELYNLATDHTEMRNLAGTDTIADTTLHDLIRQWSEWRTRMDQARKERQQTWGAEAPTVTNASR